MNKTEMVAALAEKTSLTKKDTEKVLNAFTTIIEEQLQKGEKVTLTGFGTFEARDRAAREGVNPQTKEKITIPAVKAPAFKAGKALKDALN